MPIKGSCHCGQTQFEVSEPPAGVTRCTCSLCAKRGALWAYYTPAQFRLTSPPENVATYRWGSRTVKHHFCASCGCGTYSESPDWSTGKPDFDNPKVGVNSRLFDDFVLDAVPVTVIDGKNLWCCCKRPLGLRGVKFDRHVESLELECLRRTVLQIRLGALKDGLRDEYLVGPCDRLGPGRGVDDGTDRRQVAM